MPSQYIKYLLGATHTQQDTIVREGTSQTLTSKRTRHAKLHPPKWTPKEKAAPLKEEYLQFHLEVTVYHAYVGGVLGAYPDLATQLADVPDPLNLFTEQIPVIVGAMDLITFLSDVRVLYQEAQLRYADHGPSTSTASGSATLDHGGSLDVALPIPFDGSATKARTFLAECNNYIALNRSQFPSDLIKIRWALQLCTGKAANWKCVQLELASSDVLAPEHLLHWREFQKNFQLKWADLNTKQKARQRFLAGLKQTGTVQRYAELFEELVLEAEVNDAEMIASAFYNGLKNEIKSHLVGRRPNSFEGLKAFAITLEALDEERIAAQDADKRGVKPKSTRY